MVMGRIVGGFMRFENRCFGDMWQIEYNLRGKMIAMVRV